MCLICERIDWIRLGKNPYFVKELETAMLLSETISIFKAIPFSSANSM